jgi:hypothetical protein
MTPTEIKAIADRHVDAWRNRDPRTSDKNLRISVCEAISEALKKQAKLYADGAATLRHERDAARAERDRLLPFQ